VPNFISEDQIEKAAVELLTGTYGYRALNCYTADAANPDDRSQRSTKQEVVFTAILRQAALKLNPALAPGVIEAALETLTARRLFLSPVPANKEIYELIRGGIPVQYEDEAGRNA